MLSHSFLEISVGVCPQGPLVLPLEFQSLVLAGDPAIEYPLLEESTSLEKVVTPSLKYVEVLNKKTLLD